MSNWRCRYAPSLGALEDTPENVWGTLSYDPQTDGEKPVVFFGLYGLPDFYTLWRHKGPKAVLWAGSDIIHFKNGYWLEDGGSIRVTARPLAQWLNKRCMNFVENEVEAAALRKLGIGPIIVPSFLGDITKYEERYAPSQRPKVYVSSGKDRQIEYGFGIVEDIAGKLPDIDFYLYGASWETKHDNVHVRGRVPKEVMNDEIKRMQCGLRLNDKMDGFSEITAKSVLWGQHPIVPAAYGYHGIDSYHDEDELIEKLKALKEKKRSNTYRDWYVTNLNNYPWNEK